MGWDGMGVRGGEGEDISESPRQRRDGLCKLSSELTPSGLGAVAALTGPGGLVGVVLGSLGCAGLLAVCQRGGSGMERRKWNGEEVWNERDKVFTLSWNARGRLILAERRIIFVVD